MRVTPHGAGAPFAVLEVLPVQGGQRLPRRVADAQLAIQIDARTQRALSAVELGVFVVGEALIVAAGGAKAAHAERSVMTMVDEAAGMPAAVGRATGPNGRVRYPSDRLLQRRFALGIERHHH